MSEYGLGSVNAQLKVFIGNVPNLPQYRQLDTIVGVSDGELAMIGNELGNGWRKVFNVYAKLVHGMITCGYQLPGKHEKWQDYRDRTLLRDNSQTSLLFSPPVLDTPGLKLVMGKGYAGQVIENLSAHMLDNHFAVFKQAQLIVCPYFDYRQLSNEKIETLIGLINSQFEAYLP